MKQRVASLLAGSFLLASTAQGAGYNFTMIADDSGPIATVYRPIVNDSGLVAFAAELDSGVRGIYVGTGGPLTTIVDTTTRTDSGVFERVGLGGSINASGTVAFTGWVRPDAGGSLVGGIYTGEGGPVTKVIDPTTSDFSSVSSPSINDSGVIAFEADVPGTPTSDSYSGIYTIDNGTINNIVDNSDNPDVYPERPIINASGVVLFAETTQPPDREQSLFLGSGDLPTPVVDSSPPIKSIFLQLGFNDDATVAYSTVMEDEGRGLFTINGDDVTTIVDPDGDVFSSAYYPSINSSGAVAFAGSLISGGMGLFVFDGQEIQPVILAGEQLAGKTIDGIYIEYNQILNDRGDVAFRTVFTDGSDAIYLASVIPVPPAVWLFGSALGLLGWLRRKQA